MRLWRSSAEKQAVADAKAEFEGLVAQLEADPAQAAAVSSALKNRPSLTVLSDRERATLSDSAFRRYAEVVLADDHFTVQEELAFSELAAGLGVDQETFETEYKDLLHRLVVARANDGRLSELDNPRLIRKGDEAVYLETLARLMKEVTVREYVGGYGGFSFPIARGIRFSTGSTRGRSIVVGTEFQEADSGVLSVSSERAAFLGRRKTMEFPYSKLMGLEVFTDAIAIQSAGRQATPLFTVDSGEVVAATLNAAMQRLEGKPR